MKIIHIIYDSIGNPWLNGGGAFRTHQIYQRNSQKDNITVFSGNYPYAKKVVGNVRYRRIGFPFSYLISRLSFLLLIYFHVFFSKADLYIEDVGFPIPLRIKWLKPNTIASLQWFPNASYGTKRGLLGKLIYKFFGRGLKSYDHFITVSEFAADFIKQHNSNAKVVVIPNGIDPPSKFKRDKNFTYLLYLGRIDIVSKGLDTLLEAMKLLRNSNLAIPLVIAGSGEVDEVKKLKGLVEKLDLKSTVRLMV